MISNAQTENKKFLDDDNSPIIVVFHLYGKTAQWKYYRTPSRVSSEKKIFAPKIGCEREG